MKNTRQKKEQKMSQHQDFDEDRILRRCKKDKCKVKKYKKDKTIYKKRLYKSIEELVHRYFGFCNNPQFQISVEDLNKIFRSLSHQRLSDGKISLSTIKDYIDCNSDLCKGILTSYNLYNDYSMFLYNTINNYSCRVKTVGEIHSGECCICLEDKSNMRFLSCSHDICSDCLPTIAESSPIISCPLCRDTSSTILDIDETKFVNPLCVGDLHELINLSHHFRIYYPYYCGNISSLIYVANQLGYNTSHLNNKISTRQLRHVKFASQEQIDLREISNRIMSQYEKNEWEK